MPDIAWLPWSADAFARARAERRPVLLSIVTGWSQACRAMYDTTYADPEVVAIVRERFVPIRVDADKRPDISERYSLGGWPTTAFLTGDGAIVGGGTFVTPDRMAAVLRQTAAAFETRAEEIAHAATASTGAAPLPMPVATPAMPALIDAAFATFDHEHGGFGVAPKFPLVAPLRLALHLHRDEADARALHIATLSLDAMGWGPLIDDADGGFFRCAGARDWTEPHREKLLDVNAALIELYIEAAEILGSQRYADRAHDTLRYVQNWLADQVDGGWAGSQLAEPAPDTAPAPRDPRRARPPVDRTLLAGWNGAMASAALHAARAFQDDTLGAFAITSLERVLTTAYKPGLGVAHFVDGRGARVGALLDDQFAMAAACLDAHDATGNIVYEMMAEELARYAMRAMWDGQRGVFVDHAPPGPDEAVGLMRNPLVPFVGNCEAAVVLRRLAVSLANAEFTVVADAIVAALSGSVMAHGPHIAHYVLACRTAPVR